MGKTDSSKLDDNQVIEVLAKDVKQRRDAMQEFENGKKQDLALKTKAQIKILLEYLPQQLTELEISELVRETVVKLGTNSMKHMGKVMSALLHKVTRVADGKFVSQIVKEYLNK